ncbi:MAG TPA: FHA domain-containing protein [Gemmatimonadaceae bacterium]|nr:FHA domain-containing protein [Gemmatimonadaceae bacterium]
MPVPRSPATPRPTPGRKPQPAELEAPRLGASFGTNATNGTNGTNGASGANGTHEAASAPADGAPAADDLKWAPPAEPVPANSTIQFLPGRLDVVHGRGVAGQEVRFVRPTRPGERAVVTFGRGEGPLYRHVQLNVPTVSRLHARLALDETSGDWVVENLSSTNPTVLNDDELPAGGAPRPLRDGDRLEMGEVVFTFHTQ